MIRTDSLDVAYDELQVLWDVSIEISTDDRVVALVGPNGAGKTTLLKTLSGLVPVRDGTVEIFGRDIGMLRPDEVVKLGFVHVPEERNLFGEMSVAENLEMGAYTKREHQDVNVSEIYDLFPVLEERREQPARTLSGGEQQMLAIGRGLMAEPKILALDELSVGLAPKLAERVFEKVESISEDITIFLTEQHVYEALQIADRAYLLENGRIVADAPADELLESDRIEEAYLRD